MADRVYKKSLLRNLFNVFNLIVLLFFSFLCIYPFYYIFIVSISSPDGVARGFYLFPTGIDLTTYSMLFKRDDLLRAFFISIMRTVLGSFITIFLSSFAAYLMTMEEMLFRKFVYRFMIVSMYLNAGLIPWYITMRAYGLTNNFIVYILPGALNAFFIILVKTFIEQLPASLEESAAIDGASFVKIFIFIIIPLSMPIIATIAVFAAVGQWNSWMDNFFLVNSKSLRTIQLVLYNYMDEAVRIAQSMKQMGGGGGGADVARRMNISAVNVRMAATMVTVFPILLVYPYLQKYFVKGIMLGAIKG